MGFWLSFFILAYAVICLLIIFVILLQSGEGGGLSGLVGGSSPLTESFGASGAEKTLKKWTVYLAIGFLILTMALTYLGAKQMKRTDLLEELTAEERPIPTQVVETPAPLETETSETEVTTSPIILLKDSRPGVPAEPGSQNAPTIPGPVPPAAQPPAEP